MIILSRHITRRNDNTERTSLEKRNASRKGSSCMSARSGPCVQPAIGMALSGHNKNEHGLLSIRHTLDKSGSINCRSFNNSPSRSTQESRYSRRPAKIFPRGSNQSQTIPAYSARLPYTLPIDTIHEQQTRSDPNMAFCGRNITMAAL